MNFIYDVLGSNFLVKIFLVPAMLGGIFLCKNIIRKFRFIKNKYVAFILYSSNFTFWIFLLKVLFIEIDHGSTYGYLFSDISLIFISIVVDYFVVSYYKNIEYAVILSFIIFYLFYVWSYGFHIRSTFFIFISLSLFWLTLYKISKNQVKMMQSCMNIFLISLSIVFSTQLLSLAEFPINFIYALGIFFKTFIMLVFARFIFSIILEIVEEYSKYKKFTYIDTLTNVYNRRKFEEIINEIIESEYVPKFSLVLFDVDSLKKINDTYGHSSGDYVLKELCYLIEKYLREWEENGQLFRYGGDEFFIIFRNRSGDEVQEIMNKLIQKVEKYDFYNNPYHIDVSISVGITEVIEGISQEKAIYAVDKNLYVAKANGKNQVFYS